MNIGVQRIIVTGVGCDGWRLKCDEKVLSTSGLLLTGAQYFA